MRGDTEMFKTPPKPGSSHQLDSCTVAQLMEKSNSFLDYKNYTTKQNIIRLEETIILLKLENQKLNKDFLELKRGEEEGRNRMDYLENTLKQNNLLFKGLIPPETANCTDTVLQLCNKVLCININQGDIVYSRWSGEHHLNNRPILVNFVNPLTVTKVLSNAKKLRGTNLSIDRDLCLRTRRQRGKLLKIRREVININKDVGISVGTNYLWVNTVKFFWDDNKGPVQEGKEGIGVLNQLVGGDLSGAMRGLIAQPDEEGQPK